MLIIFMIAQLTPAPMQNESGPARPTLRPPAVPLIAIDPYFSVWSCADHLTDDVTRHWTKAKHPLSSMIRVDGKCYRLMGPEPKEIAAMPQTAVEVWPTRTICRFQNPQVEITMIFLTPALMDDLDLLARPITYLSWEVRSKDGADHDVSIYSDAGGELTVNTADQEVVGSRESWSHLIALRIGSKDQPVLQKKGDNLRIDWGYLYLAAKTEGSRGAIGSAEVLASAFAANGELPAQDDPRMPRAVRDQSPALALVCALGRVGAVPVSRHVMLAYDDLYSIRYGGRRLRPYWRRNGAEAKDLLEASDQEYEILKRRCEIFDRELVGDLAKIGGERYAWLCALAYRQCLAANKLAADAQGMPLLFPKENTSNGCIATVDVIYPMAPLFLLMSPPLAKASLAPVLNYAASSRWKFPFAPHDIGTYPLATGQVYGGAERTEVNQMPVEESGNMLLLLAAVAHRDGNADFASMYWPQTTRWAEYLAAKGFDPENQLCTDDFAGHLAHNANLSIKAIEALGAYASLCSMRRDEASAGKFRNLAQEMAAHWMPAADDGDHFRLAFDRPGTWSQKYNLVWDRILGLNLFPAEVARKELAFYKKEMNAFGLPLDNRKQYAKLDWSLWTATLADTREGFDQIVSPIFDFLHQTQDRTPMTDLYWTHTGRERSMHARPVVGGVFIKMMTDEQIWRKWSSRGKPISGSWAPMPGQPRFAPVVPSAQEAPIRWRYTTKKPPADWYKPGFDDSSWEEGPAGFGTAATPGSVVRTEWKTDDIWLRREFDLPERKASELQFICHHDEDVEIYLNGILSAKDPGYLTTYELLPIRPIGRAGLKIGKNTLAAHCHQTTGGQYIDVGIVEIVEDEK